MRKPIDLRHRRLCQRGRYQRLLQQHHRLARRLSTTASGSAAAAPPELPQHASVAQWNVRLEKVESWLAIQPTACVISPTSLFAANGVSGHYYAVCYSDTNVNTGGDAGPCTTDPSRRASVGPPSPVPSGSIQALVNQYTHGPRAIRTRYSTRLPKCGTRAQPETPPATRARAGPNYPRSL